MYEDVLLPTDGSDGTGRVVDHAGTPTEELLRHVERSGIDLVVMGTHGPTGLPRRLLGSVTERLVRRSPVPVLTVPLAGEEAGGRPGGEPRRA